MEIAMTGGTESGGRSPQTSAVPGAFSIGL